MRLFLLSFLVVAGLTMISHAGEVTVQSGPARVSLLELFTSEGCSSCPPAERWLSGLRKDPRLWKEVVPVAFHVDYWDELGWPDRFARPAFSDRQRAYAASWGSDSVYTPGFVLNGAEWRARDLDAISTPGASVGILTATLRADGGLRISFRPSAKGTGKWEAHAALLGLGAVSKVKGGENRGEELVHDFVVLSLRSAILPEDSSGVTLHLPAGEIKPGTSALAVWVTMAGGLEPVQAAGGNL